MEVYEPQTKTRTPVSDLYTDDSKENVTKTLAVFVTSIFTVEPDGNLPELDIKDVSKLDSLTIYYELLGKKLEALKINKSPGPDGISPTILKELSDVVVESSTIIFSNSVNTVDLLDM